MDSLTAERYPHGVPWTERPGYLTAEQQRRRQELLAGMRRWPVKYREVDEVKPS